MNTLTRDFARWARDAGARALRTAVGTFSSMLLLGLTLDVSLLEQAAMTAATAGFSVLLALAAKWAGDPGTATFTTKES